MTIEVEFHCHVRPPYRAQVEFVINGTDTVVNIEPTINWVMGSTPAGSRLIKLSAPLGLVDFVVTARHSDVIICGYSSNFDYATQPTWSDGSCFMDITGHGPDQDLQGPGSLVLPQDVTVTFQAQIGAV